MPATPHAQVDATPAVGISMPWPTKKSEILLQFTVVLVAVVLQSVGPPTPAYSP